MAKENTVPAIQNRGEAMKNSQKAITPAAKSRLSQKSITSFFGPRATPPAAILSPIPTITFSGLNESSPGIVSSAAPSPAAKSAAGGLEDGPRTPSVTVKKQKLQVSASCQLISSHRSSQKVSTVMSPLASSLAMEIDASEGVAINDQDEESSGMNASGKRSHKRKSYIVFSESEDEIGVASKKDQHKKFKKKTGKADGEFEPQASSDDDDDMDADPTSELETEVIENDSDDQLVSPKVLKMKSSFKTPVPSSSKKLKEFQSTPASAWSVGSSQSRSVSSQSKAKLDHFASASSTRRQSLLSKDQTPKDTPAAAKQKHEERYPWLAKVRDLQGNDPTSPSYDPRTLFIPQSAWDKFTAFEKQFWEIKSAHFDTVVFFKKGKFFELYENDAAIGHKEFDLKLTDRVNMKMVGVPESSFDDWAAKFLARGHKIAKVEQMENAIAKEIRGKTDSNAKAEKVLKRELTSILTLGTLVDGGLITSDMSSYCMSIKELTDDDSLAPKYGVVFVDTSTAEFHLCGFEDDAQRTRFETLIVQLKPQEVCFEKGKLSLKSHRILKNNLPRTIYNGLHPDREFLDANLTKDDIRRKGYFEVKKNGEDSEMLNGDDDQSWPEALKTFYNDDGVMSALGGLVWYLSSLKIDRKLMSARNFHVYDPVRHSTSLVLDGQTIINLEIFENNYDGTDTGSLYKLLMRCFTPFGKRLFKRWLCHPLRHADIINQRLDAVEDLDNIRGVQEDLGDAFKRLPDLERIISRIHGGNASVKEFIRALGSFKTLAKVFQSLEPYLSEFRSKRLGVLCKNPFSEELMTRLEYFHESFDHKAAEKEGVVYPHEGYDEEYDAACKAVKETEKELQEYLRKKKKELGSNEVSFKDLGKELFQLEVPKRLKFFPPSNWFKLSETKAATRYHTAELRALAKDFVQRDEIKSMVSKTIKERLFSKFDEHYEPLLRIVRVIAELDCLISLAKSKCALGDVCRPEFVTEGESVLELEEMRHPCVQQSSISDFIPNDTHIGGGNSSIILLTGPNMAGKSTLLRQTCIAVIMAQLGCYVPAKKCRLSPFDRIFTRIGANDNILGGQSTFMVELAETSRIMKEATSNSLVILDELGRGTSTYDGYSIAYSVLHFLTRRIRCLGLFSTHYQSLTREYEHDPLVALMYMSYLEDETNRDITFLYKLTKGVSPKSYGMHVAQMAGVLKSVVDRAEEVAGKFEQQQKLKEVEQVANLSTVPLIRYSDLSYLVHHCETGKKIDSEVVKAIWRSFQNVQMTQ